MTAAATSASDDILQTQTRTAGTERLQMLYLLAEARAGTDQRKTVEHAHVIIPNAGKLMRKTLKGTAALALRLKSMTDLITAGMLAGTQFHLGG